MLMEPIKIQSVDLVDEQITVLYEELWFQEDIEKLRAALLNDIPNHNIKEITIGADRENIRFEWQLAEFVLNFDCYSQSCWFSAQDESSKSMLPSLFAKLTANKL